MLSSSLGLDSVSTTGFATVSRFTLDLLRPSLPGARIGLGRDPFGGGGEPGGDLTAVVTGTGGGGTGAEGGGRFAGGPGN